MKVSKDVATQDFKRFTDGLKISDKKLSKLQDEKDQFIELIQFGNIIIKDDLSVVYKLDIPLDDANISELIFECKRVKVSDIEKRMTGKTDMEKSRNMMSFLTGQNSSLLGEIDADDFISLSSIASFFLPR